jgi:hypothetical protein
MIRARFAHTNLVADDWRQLASFYEEVFGCIPLPPERMESRKGNIIELPHWSTRQGGDDQHGQLEAKRE